MTDEEIIQKLVDNTWWPFDQVDPKLLAIADKKVKQQSVKEMEDALL